MENTTDDVQTVLPKMETRVYELLNRLDGIESTLNLMQCRMGKQLDNTSLKIRHSNGASNSANMHL